MKAMWLRMWAYVRGLFSAAISPQLIIAALVGCGATLLAWGTFVVAGIGFALLVSGVLTISAAYVLARGLNG